MEERLHEREACEINKKKESERDDIQIDGPFNLQQLFRSTGCFHGVPNGHLNLDRTADKNGLLFAES